MHEPLCWTWALDHRMRYNWCVSQVPLHHSSQVRWTHCSHEAQGWHFVGTILCGFKLCLDSRPLLQVILSVRGNCLCKLRSLILCGSCNWQTSSKWGKEDPHLWTVGALYSSVDRDLIWPPALPHRDVIHIEQMEGVGWRDPGRFKQNGD